MPNFKIGDVVARKSYNYDVLFKVVGYNLNGQIDLIGINVRITADAYEYDLKLINSDELKLKLKNIENNRKERINRSISSINRKNYYNRDNNYMYYQNNYRDVYTKDKLFKKPGKVLHIDGDEEYTLKCREMYKKLGINAYVLNIPESEQYRQVYNLLKKVNPNILIITGHDAFIKRRNDIYNIDNYKNSKYFVQSVLEARRYEHSLDDLVIYAGACQSYYEAIISAGANFASAPKRVLIDMTDPIIVAQTIAYTPVNEIVSLDNIFNNTREGINGIGGIQTKGQYRVGMPGI